MREEYLWDRSGEPDPEIAKLERALAEFRYRGETRRVRPQTMALAAAAACLIIAAVSGTFWLHRKPVSEWQIAGKRISVGETIETGINSKAKLEAQSFGEVQLEPNSRLQVLPSSGGNQRLALRRGTMHALIWAPPANFFVDTPSARAIDLGCSYTLTVLPDDSGLLTVQTGWVAFQNGSIESFIPAGAACHTRPNLGTGLPYFASTSKELRDAITKFDETGGREGLPQIVASARKQDAITLWHLLVRTSGTARDQVAQRFVTFFPQIDVSGLKSGSNATIDKAWNALGLGETAWWRKWKHTWQQ
jgi:hypothetical protein